MAKDFDSALFDKPTKEKQTKPIARKKRDIFDIPLNAKTTRKAVGDKSMSGNYKSVKFNLPPEQVIYLDSLAAKFGMGRLDFRRWLVDLALQQIEGGHVPEMDKTLTSMVAKLGHTTSKLG